MALYREPQYGYCRLTCLRMLCLLHLSVACFNFGYRRCRYGHLDDIWLFTLWCGPFPHLLGWSVLGFHLSASDMARCAFTTESDSNITSLMWAAAVSPRRVANSRYMRDLTLSPACIKERHHHKRRGPPLQVNKWIS